MTAISFETVYTVLDEKTADELVDFLTGYTVNFSKAEIRKVRAKKILEGMDGNSLREKVTTISSALGVSIPHAYKLARSADENK